MKYAAFSLILPELSFEEQVALLKELGYDAIELRIADVPPERQAEPFSYWGNHRDPIGPSNLKANLKRLRRVTEENAVRLCAFASYVGLGDRAGFEPLAAAAAEIGVGMVRVTAPRFEPGRDFAEQFTAAVAGLEEIEGVAARHGVRALVEIHHGTIAPSASAARRIVEGFDPAAVGVILDPGNMLNEGYERWALSVGILGPYLAHVHAKNAFWVLRAKPAGGPYEWEPRWTRLREGFGNWRGILAALRAAGYAGYLSLEDFTDQPARDKLGDAVAFLRSLNASEGSPGQ